MTHSVETPKYEVVVQDGPIELRDYPDMVAAQIQRRGKRWESVNRAFMPLAGYIFAEERGGEKIAMTAPVTQQLSTVGGGAAGVEKAGMMEGDWRIRFIMPSEYDMDSLPEPVADDIRLVEIPAAQVAAIRFSGVATDESVADNEARLMAWVAARGLAPRAAPTIAYYNDPFTPGFMRRNEVLVEVGPVDVAAVAAPAEERAFATLP